MSMRQQAQGAENELRFIQGGIRQYARLLHDELKRRYPRHDRIQRYTDEIEKLKALRAFTPEMP